jgi:hypothetical protein
MDISNLVLKIKILLNLRQKNWHKCVGHFHTPISSHYRLCPHHLFGQENWINIFVFHVLNVRKWRQSTYLNGQKAPNSKTLLTFHVKYYPCIYSLVTILTFGVSCILLYGGKTNAQWWIFFAIPSFYFLLALHCRLDLSLDYTITKNNKHKKKI